MIIRRAENKDISQIKELFMQTIMSVNLGDYTLDQIRCWASKGDDDNVWKERIAEQYFIVGLSDDIITGFAALKSDGYLNSLFVHKNYQGRGVASLLLHDIENYAIQKNLPMITADVSITAKPFFERKGYKVLREQTVNIGVEMVNYKMEKAF